jgi:hypothetical protein
MTSLPGWSVKRVMGPVRPLIMVIRVVHLPSGLRGDKRRENRSCPVGRRDGKYCGSCRRRTVQGLSQRAQHTSREFTSDLLHSQTPPESRTFPEAPRGFLHGKAHQRSSPPRQGRSRWRSMVGKVQEYQVKLPSTRRVADDLTACFPAKPQTDLDSVLVTLSRGVIRRSGASTDEKIAGNRGTGEPETDARDIGHQREKRQRGRPSRWYCMTTLRCTPLRHPVNGKGPGLVLATVNSSSEQQELAHLHELPASSNGVHRTRTELVEIHPR